MPIKTAAQIKKEIRDGMRGGVILTWQNLEKKEHELAEKLKHLEELDEEGRSHLDGKDLQLDRWGEETSIEDMKEEDQMLLDAEKENFDRAHELGLDREDDEEELLFEECDSLEEARAVALDTAKEFEDKGLKCTISESGGVFSVTVHIPNDQGISSENVHEFFDGITGHDHFNMNENSGPMGIPDKWADRIAQEDHGGEDHVH
jgi:hypothetical protein